MRTLTARLPPLLSSFTGRQTPLLASIRSFASRKPAAPDLSEDEVKAARNWLEKLDAETIPRSIGKLTFSRSSGAGGQNVNKVNSKATLKVPLTALLSHIPIAFHPSIRASRYVASRSDSLVIQADNSRKQNDNAHSCYAKLHQTILEAAKSAIPGETSEQQAKHVKNLQNIANERRLKSKKMQSSRKSARRIRDD